MVSTNCRGTLLYWIGARDEDSYANPEDITSILHQYTPTTKPNLGDLALWRPIHEGFVDVLHAGLVVQRSPIIVASRLGGDGPIRKLEAPHVMPALGWYYDYHIEYHRRTDADLLGAIMARLI